MVAESCPREMFTKETFSGMPDCSWYNACTKTGKIYQHHPFLGRRNVRKSGFLVCMYVYHTVTLNILFLTFNKQVQQKVLNAFIFVRLKTACINY
jgi:hypothetical protein